MQNRELRRARWRLFLEQFSFDVVHKPGYQNVDADGISRNPVRPPLPIGQEDDAEIPSLQSVVQCDGGEESQRGRTEILKRRAAFECKTNVKKASRRNFQ